MSSGVDSCFDWVSSSLSSVVSISRIAQDDLFGSQSTAALAQLEVDAPTDFLMFEATCEVRGTSLRAR